MKLSSLLDRFAEPETLKMAKLGRELRAKGVDVIDLSLGEPDFDTRSTLKMRPLKPSTITGATIRPYPVSWTFVKQFALN